MDCPYCGFHFKLFVANQAEIPDVAPIVCEQCAEIGLLEHGVTRKLTADELEAVKQSPAYRDVLLPAIDIIKRTWN